MKKILTIILFLPFISFSQINTDSLFKFVYNDSEQDTDRITAGRHLIVNFLDINIDTAEHVLSTLTTILPNIENPKYISKYHSLAGYIYQKKGLPDSALHHQKLRLTINKKIGDKKQIAGGYHNIANSYIDLGELDKAEVFYNKALTKNKEIGNILWQIYNLGGLSRLYSIKNRYTKSHLYATESFDLALKNNLVDAHRYYAYGLSCTRINNLTLSLEIYQKGSALAKKTGDIYYQILNDIEVAECYRDMGEMKKSEESFLNVLEISKTIKNTEITAQIYGELAKLYNLTGKNNKALSFAKLSTEIYKKSNDYRGYFVVALTIGSIHRDMGNNDSSIVLYNSLIDLSEKYNFIDHRMVVYNNLSLSYSNVGNFQKAIELLYTVLDSAQGDLQKIASAHNNIGLLYQDAELYPDARVHFNKALSTWSNSNSSFASFENAAPLHNLANLDRIEDNLIRADSLLEMAIKINLDFERYDWLGNNFGLKGQIFEKKGLIDSAILYIRKGNEIHNKYQYYTLLSRGLYMEAELRLDNEETPISLFKEAYTISKKFNDYKIMKKSALGLFKCFKKTGEQLKAVKYLEVYHTINDSLSEKERDLTINKMKFKRDLLADSLNYEKKQALSEAQIRYEKSKVKSEKQKNYYLYFGLLITIVLGGIVFNRLKITRKQKIVIEEAHTQLEEKNHEILDSISYAKRIQSAILPPQKLVKEYLKDSFILYIPKDIVAGDFYWMEHKDNKVIFAAADCTGHGVPGAMVSVVCSNALNYGVRELGITDPGKLLDVTRELVIERFERSEDEVKDGMDIALCSLEGHQLQYAGAHNPLWIIRNGANEIEEIKADKQPIGKFNAPKPYTTHNIELNKGDTFYIFSDGYADQFGGEKGKKFKTKNFKTLLLSIQNKTIEQQKDIINKSFENWMGDLEQLDDVCVIGVRM
jgi:serine phosphatase RsbU (regulator of sigma subunit)/tetratricopeptide (TPR) repeat protein